MSRYPGFITLLLILVCLWINIVRYPSVWVMVRGKPVGQLNTMASLLDDQDQRSDPEDMIAADNEISKLPAFDPDQPVSYDTDLNKNSGIYTGKPMPVADKRFDKQTNEEHKMEAKAVSNSNESSEKSPSSIKRDKSKDFRNAGLSGKGWHQPRESEEDESSSDKDQKKKNASGQNKTEENENVSADLSGEKSSEPLNSTITYNEGKIVPVSGTETEHVSKTVRLIPATVQNEARYKSAVYYRAPGEEGTSPMDLSQPVYGPVDAQEVEGGSFRAFAVHYEKK